jgi:hypothetical protein
MSQGQDAYHFQCGAWFTAFSDRWTSNQIREALGWTPSEMWDKDLASAAQKQKLTPMIYSGCIFASGLPESDPLSAHLEAVCSRVSEHLDTLALFRNRGHLSYDVRGMFGASEPITDRLPVSVLKVLSALQCDLMLDLYPPDRQAKPDEPVHSGCQVFLGVEGIDTPGKSITALIDSGIHRLRMRKPVQPVGTVFFKLRNQRGRSSNVPSDAALDSKLGQLIDWIDAHANVLSELRDAGARACVAAYAWAESGQHSTFLSSASCTRCADHDLAIMIALAPPRRQV